MEKILVVYTSTTGNTQAMAEAVAEGIRAAGAEADCIDACMNPSVADFDKIALGSPAMGAEVLEESVFGPFFSAIENQLQGKKIALFGSYGWGDGQWMRDWQDRVEQDGGVLFEQGLIINGMPDEEGKAECRSFGERFAAF